MVIDWSLENGFIEDEVLEICGVEGWRVWVGVGGKVEEVMIKEGVIFEEEVEGEVEK